jgi:hypothetical protein
MRSPVAIVATASDQYWEWFGQQFTEMIGNLQIKPAEVFLITENAVEVPAWWGTATGWDSSRTPAANFSLGANEAAQHIEADWMLVLPVDDTLDPSFFNDLPLETPAVNVAGRWANGFCYGTPDQYERLLDLGHNGMPGLTVFATETFRQFPYRTAKFADWINWCELRANNIPASFVPDVRWTWGTHAHQLGNGDDPQLVQSILDFCQLLKTGNVQPGSEWPPIVKSAI